MFDFWEYDYKYLIRFILVFILYMLLGDNIFCRGSNWIFFITGWVTLSFGWAVISYFQSEKQLEWVWKWVTPIHLSETKPDKQKMQYFLFPRLPRPTFLFKKHFEWLYWLFRVVRWKQRKSTMKLKVEFHFCLKWYNMRQFANWLNNQKIAQSVIW